MQQDTPDADRVARTVAETIYFAFCQQATMPAHRLAEQTVLTRLMEAIRPQAQSASPDGIVDAANAALDAWEQQDPQIRGPRISAVDLADGAVTLRLA